MHLLIKKHFKPLLLSQSQTLRFDSKLIGRRLNYI